MGSGQRVSWGGKNLKAETLVIHQKFLLADADGIEEIGAITIAAPAAKSFPARPAGPRARTPGQPGGKPTCDAGREPDFARGRQGQHADLPARFAAGTSRCGAVVSRREFRLYRGFRNANAPKRLGAAVAFGGRIHKLRYLSVEINSDGGMIVSQFFTLLKIMYSSLRAWHRRIIMCLPVVFGILAADLPAQTTNLFWQTQSIYQIITDRFYDGDTEQRQRGRHLRASGNPTRRFTAAISRASSRNWITSRRWGRRPSGFRRSC